MSLKTVNTALTTAGILFVLWFGLTFVLAPGTIAPTFGLPSWPAGDGGGFLVLKGVRDVANALILGVLLLTGQRRALAWVLLAGSVVPFGDMATVLAHHGSAGAAFGVHGPTGVAMVVIGLLTLWETRRLSGAPTSAPTSAPVPAPVRAAA
ncbi:DUF4267 domain-containing protein [Kitasatospora sp. NPDC059146]|uniref:DUF4267 domain-containing protein n=1 Tax=unclassified Kitasatospora TaxID=2633591 RepID=UPI0036D06AD9